MEHSRVGVAPGTVFHDRYTLLRPLGVGGTGTTFLARDALYATEVALKCVGPITPALGEVLRNEFVRLSGLSHPSLTRVLDFGAAQHAASRILFYTSELVVGTTLDEYAQGRTWHDVRRALADTACALAFLHHVGIRHGDVKPVNVLVDNTGRGVLIDLGCARPLPRDDEPRAIADALSGTREFLAPELLEGRVGDARADLFAFGKSLALVRNALVGDVPASVSKLIGRLTASDASDRPSDALEVAEALGADHADVVAARAPGSGEPPRLLGRANEMARWNEILSDAAARKPAARVLWIVGPDGAGKTRLLREMKWAAQQRCNVVEGSAHVHGAVTSMLARASGQGDLAMDLGRILAAREQLTASPIPVVFVMDDIDALGATERATLDALLRSTASTDPLVWLVAASSPPDVEMDAIETMRIGPLEADDVRTWIAPYIDTRALPSVMRVTRGLPRTVRDVCARVARGDLTEAELARVDETTATEAPAVEAAKKSSAQARRVLGVVALLDGSLRPDEVAHFGLSQRDIARLVEQGWFEHDGAGVRWCSTVGGGAFVHALNALEPESMQQLRREVARHLEHTAAAKDLDIAVRAERMARRVYVLGHDIDPREAAAIFIDNTGLAASSPQAWARAADALADHAVTPETQLARARVYESGGRAERALGVLSRLLRTRPSRGLLLELRYQAGSCYLKLGHPKRARRHLDAALGAITDTTPRAPARRAEIVDLICRTLIQEGLHREAATRATAALAWTDEPSIAASLHESIGVAAGYLGDPGTARVHLGRAATLAQESGSIRARARVLSYEAILEYREGNTDRAASLYERVLDLAEQHGLSDYVASAALNLGTACHQRGDWGRALASYERGLRMAVALGKTSTVAILRWNLAKLYADIGSFDRADAALTALTTSSSGTAEALLGPISSLEGEIALARGNLSAATSHFRGARETYRRHGTTREALEADLQIVDAMLGTGETSEARALLSEHERAARDSTAADVRARYELARGRVFLAEGNASEALGALERARDDAQAAGQRALTAEVEDVLAAACRLASAPMLEREHVAHARAQWERIAASLPTTLRDAFWRHPRRASAARIAATAPATLNTSVPQSTSAASVDSLSPKLRRLLEINRRLNESLDTNDVLRLTMDAAIELTSAERGFLIVKRTPANAPDAVELDVAVARNMDREKIDKSHLKFSRGIAEKVISTGEPLLTVDALEDERFRANASVHAMRLRSVLSVPIRTIDGVLGALYLDNRFQKGRFRESDLELLVAFADQVGIALRNARLHAELAQRTRDLDTERRRIERLLRQQASEIERLGEEVRVRQDALEHKFDYANIIGRSKPMLDVLSVLDRVIDSSLSMLVQGESGTGKELVARAIPFNGPRRKAPFVTVNCAALSDALLESELFGHVRGAFTGAMRDRTGLFVEARGGTLFLDELGEMSSAMQVKLLRVLQEREVRPVGSSEVIPVDVRLVCATNRDIRREVAEGRFREDLYYRVGVVTVTLPSLRARADDIPELATHLLERIAREQGKSAPRIGPQAMRTLLAHHWPGNVRELENVLAKALLLARSDTLGASDIELGAPPRPTNVARSRKSYEANESSVLLDALNQRAWNVSEVARALGIPRTTLYRKLRKHGLLRDDMAT